MLSATMIEVTDSIALHEDEIQEEFIRSSGPGGQHVNKTESAVQLRFDVAHSPSLPEDVRARLSRLARGRITEDGILIIEARRYRSQLRNRTDALERLIALIQKAAVPPRPRRKTKATMGSRKRRLEKKRRRGDTKRLRGRVDRDD